MIRLLVPCLAIGLAAAPALAQDSSAQQPPVVATASTVKGPVKVNQGEKFLPLAQGAALRQGDRVMALRQGSAVLRFEDGCDLQVKPETVVVVPDRSPCAGAVVASHGLEPAGSGAVGAGANWSGLENIVVPWIIGDAILFGEGDKDTLSP